MIKRFKSPTDAVVRVVCPIDIYRVGPQWRPLPEKAWKYAYAEGCISEEQITKVEEAPPTIMSSNWNKQSYKDLYLDLTEEGVKFVTTKGALRLSVIRKKVGSQDFNEFVAQDAWAELKAKVEKEQE